MRVMLVDDAKYMRKIIKNILIENGHEVVSEAASGVEAIEIYKETKPDIVFMDILMPDMDGIQTVKEIVKYDPETRIIMCSAVGQDTRITEAIDSGAKGYIIKPFKPDKVLKAIAKIL